MSTLWQWFKSTVCAFLVSVSCGPWKYLPKDMAALLLAWLNTPSSITDSVCGWEASVGSCSCQQQQLPHGVTCMMAMGSKGRKTAYKREANSLSRLSQGEQRDVSVTGTVMWRQASIEKGVSCRFDTFLSSVTCFLKGLCNHWGPSAVPLQLEKWLATNSGLLSKELSLALNFFDCGEQPLWRWERKKEQGIAKPKKNK